MTTIAIDHKSIAADGRVGWDGIIATDKEEKVKEIDGVIFAWMGNEAQAKELSKYITGEIDTVSSDMQGYVVTIQDGEVLHHSVNNGVYTADSVNLPYAFGSGQHFALSALDMGMSAKEAVEYAMTRDPQTGGQVKVIDWGENNESN